MTFKNPIVTFNKKKIYVHGPRDYISNSLINYGCWEPNITYFIDKKFHKSNIFIDVGGNLGYYSICFSDNFEEIFCFEPNKENTLKIEKSIIENKISNIEVIKKPVASKSLLKFSPVNRNNHDGNNVGGIQYVASNDGIETICLDDFIKSKNLEHIDLLKIDIEGGELDCLNGARESIETKKIKNILIEITPLFSYNQSLKILSLLNKNYQLYDLGLDEMGFFPTSSFQVTKINNIEKFLNNVKKQTNIYCSIR